MGNATLRGRLRLAVCVLAGLGAMAASASELPPPPPACAMAVLASLPLARGAPIPLVSGQINGRKVQLAVGLSSLTAVYRGAAKGLDVLEEASPHRTIAAPVFNEIGLAWVRDLELDGMPRDVLSRYDVHEAFHMAVETGPSSGAAGPSGVLGAQFWSLADDDFDLASGLVRLVRSKGCGPADALPFNGGAYSETPLLTPSVRAIDYVVAVKVDGVPLRAEIDTGAPVTLMTRQGAAKLSRVWPLPAARAEGSFTAGQEAFPWFAARFTSFSIGQESITNPTIVLADVYGRDQARTVRSINGTNRWLRPYRPDAATTPDMILGADFFRAHRVLIANSRRVVYFAYNGAPYLR